MIAAATSTTTEQLEYHGIYVIFIAAMLLIVVGLAIGAVREVWDNRRRRGED